MKNELAAQEAQWKEAYDFVMAENQSLKASGSEALLAAQWRQRYESLLTEKEDLETRLGMEVEKADVVADQRRKVDAGKYEMKYKDLKESFRLYRKKAKEIFEAQQRGDVGVSQHCSVICSAFRSVTNHEHISLTKSYMHPTQNISYSTLRKRVRKMPNCRTSVI
jgi:hypothetical protein